MNTELQPALDIALSQLPEHDLDVIRLRCCDRFSYEEIAGRSGRTPKGVRMLCGRAIQKLPVILQTTESS